MCRRRSSAAAKRSTMRAAMTIRVASSKPSIRSGKVRPGPPIVVAHRFREGGGERRGECRDRTVHQAGESGLDDLQHESTAVVVGFGGRAGVGGFHLSESASGRG
ncbi:MAG: hypothetical protein CMJ54_12465 [Planctomycetaceae bacterium]|nr:hypothetical protein [Planctomycetaceae bacterium]